MKTRIKYAGLFIAFLLFLSACVYGPESLRQAEEEILPLDPKVTVGTLDNGLTYYIRENSWPAGRAELRLVINAGSVLEDEDQQGLAHFVEHMAFNGTRNLKKEDIVDFLESLGMRYGPELNASTDYDETIYKLQVPTADSDILEKAVRILEEWAWAISFEEAEIDKERPVIIEEWRLGRGAAARMRDRQLPVLYRGSRYAERRPIGKLEIIENSSSEQLRRFYRDWYRPDLMAVIAVGDFDGLQMEELIRRRFSALKSSSPARERPAYPVPDHEETLFALASDPEATTTLVSIFKKQDVIPVRIVSGYRKDMFDYLYHGILNERLEELAKKPDPPFLTGFSGKGKGVRTKELYVLGARVEDGRIMTGLEALLIEAERVRRHGFTATELERQKERILKWMEHAYNERENMESLNLAEEYIRNFLQEEPIPGIEYEYELFKKYMPGITLEEINEEAARWLSPENRVIMVNAPEKEGLSLPSEEELLAIFQRVRDKEIEAFEDKVPDKPLITGVLAGAEISGRKVMAELGVTELELSNGVRVVLKPTDFKRDQVVFAAFSPGGHSLVKDEDYIAAATAASLVSEGGVGEFNAIELEKKLAGKVVEVSPWIGELYEGIRGKATPSDLETMFQLIYLYFDSPRRDEQAFSAYRARLAASLENRLASPEAVFWDTVQTIITRNHPRARPWNTEVLAEMDLDASYSIYRDRFADAGDFTFFLVGNFVPDEIEPFIKTYLGSLPSRGRVETWRDTGIDPPGGIIEETVRKGLEPKSRVQIIFSGEASWSPQARFNLQALAEVLDIELRKVVREDAGGTYGVGSEAVLSHYPDEEYHVYLGFGCAPEKVEELSELVFKKIRQLQSGTVPEETVAKVKEIFKREHEKELKENVFWLQTLQFHYAHHLDPLDILKYDELIEALDTRTIKTTAQEFLNMNNYVRVLLYPEER